MSTVNTTNLKNPSSGSNNIVLATDGSATIATAKITPLADSAGSNTSTPAAIANGIAKAWVNFNGTGTVAIRASYNVSSITDNGTGQYTINFTNAMTDANYSVVGAVSDASAPGGSEVFAMLRGGLSTTSCPVDSVAYTSSNIDVPFNCWSIFR
jgi:hypothetical protein